MDGSIDITLLVTAAQEARRLAYAPYSGYQVGAALFCADGEVITGCNIENATFPAGCCAERVAIFRAVAAGKHGFLGIAVATRNGGSPCGICRQVMREFAPAMPVYIADETGLVRTTSVANLLPDSFGPEDLGYITGNG